MTVSVFVSLVFSCLRSLSLSLPLLLDLAVDALLPRRPGAFSFALKAGRLFSFCSRGSAFFLLLRRLGVGV